MTAKRAPTLVALLATATVLLCAAIAGPASAAVHRHIDGTVVSKNAKDQSFKMSTQNGTVRIRVNSATVFDRISGFGGLRKGSEIEVEARQTSSGLLATKIEPRGHSGGHGDGGRHEGGADDGPNHT